MRNAHRRHSDDGTQMEGQASTPGVVEAGRVHEQHVRDQLEGSHGRGQDRALPPGQQAWRVTGRNPRSHDGLSEEVVRPTRRE